MMLTPARPVDRARLTGSDQTAEAGSAGSFWRLSPVTNLLATAASPVECRPPTSVDRGTGDRRCNTDGAQPYCLAHPPVPNWTTGSEVTPASCIFAFRSSWARKARSVSKDSAWW
jgi:hypothetical protein